MVLALGLASAVYAAPLAYCGFEPNEDPPAYALGALNGQGSAINGWNGAWFGSDSYQVKSTDSPPVGTQSMDLHVVGSTKGINRMITGWNEEDYTISLYNRVTNEPDWANSGEIILRNNATGARALHVKFEPLAATPEFRINEQNMLDFVNPGGNLKSATDWVQWQIVYTAATTTYDLYWETIGGELAYVGSHTGHKDAGAGLIDELKLNGPKCNSDPAAGLDYDEFAIVPEPATLGLLAVGGLFVMRRRRA
jgi:hypothetical protein